MTHKNVCAVDEMFHPLFCNKQHFIKEEEGPLFFNPLNPEGTFQNQLSKAAEIRTSPVSQQTLNLLSECDKFVRFHFSANNFSLNCVYLCVSIA